MQTKVGPLFASKGSDLQFHVEYVQSLRNWKESLPSLASMSGAYRKRNKHDQDVIPHSFTFVPRCRDLIWTSNPNHFLRLANELA